MCVQVTKGRVEKAFFSMPEYEQWKRETEGHRSWKTKYYKGLGTSTAKEAKEYFSDMDRHKIPFRYSGQDDDEAILLVGCVAPPEYEIEHLNRSAILSCLYEFDWPYFCVFEWMCIWWAILEKCMDNVHWPPVICTLGSVARLVFAVCVCVAVGL